MSVMVYETVTLYILNTSTVYWEISTIPSIVTESRKHKIYDF